MLVLKVLEYHHHVKLAPELLLVNCQTDFYWMIGKSEELSPPLFEETCH